MKMAALPSPTQVAGSHNPIYEAYYLLVDPNNHGRVGALDAAKFLKKSGLSDAILSKIWDLSDPNGKGYLNKPGFFVALKLVSLAQNSREVNIANILSDVPPPKMADVPAVIQNNVINSVQATLSDWAVKPHEREKYDQLFNSLQPLNGVIPGNKVKGLLMDSKLPVDTLGKIWDLADMDKDGSLDRHEFVVAMHLVYKALEKYAIPNSVPPELLPPGKRKDPFPPTTAPIIPIAPITKPVEPVKPIMPPAPQAPWVVTAEERQRYDAMFHHADVDKDGFVSGHEIKNVFLQSGVPQAVLAQIWGLCDMKQTGKLNGEQFALAMWLISQKLQGKDPPAALTPEMIPPSARGKSAESLAIQNALEDLVEALVKAHGAVNYPLFQENPVQVTKPKSSSLRVRLLKNTVKKKLEKLRQLSGSQDQIKEGNILETSKEKQGVVEELSVNGSDGNKDEIDASLLMDVDCESEMKEKDVNKNNNSFAASNKKRKNNNYNDNVGDSNVNRQLGRTEKLDTNEVVMMGMDCEDEISYQNRKKRKESFNESYIKDNIESDQNFIRSVSVKLEMKEVMKHFKEFRVTQDREE